MSLKVRFCSTLLTVVIFSLVSVSCVGADGVMPKNFTGTWKENYANGSKKSEMTYKDGKKDGISILWYESGCPMSVHYFKENMLDGPMIKWEKCEGIIAIGEYQDDKPWNGYFLVNPATAEAITSTTVYESGLTYYVIEYTNGQAFKSLSKEILERQLNSNPVYKEILNKLDIKR